MTFSEDDCIEPWTSFACSVSDASIRRTDTVGLLFHLILALTHGDSVNDTSSVLCFGYDASASTKVLFHSTLLCCCILYCTVSCYLLLGGYKWLTGFNEDINDEHINELIMKNHRKTSKQHTISVKTNASNRREQSIYTRPEKIWNNSHTGFISTHCKITGSKALCRMDIKILHACVLMWFWQMKNWDWKAVVNIWLSLKWSQFTVYSQAQTFCYVLNHRYEA